MDVTPPDKSAPDADGADSTAVRRAYDERTTQLHEARGALGEAVAALSAELASRREESGLVSGERDRAVREAEALRAEVIALQHRVAELETALTLERGKVAELEGMKVVRYTKLPRHLVYRWRAQRRA